MNYSPLYGTAREVPEHLQGTLTGTKGVQGIPSVNAPSLTGPEKVAA